MVWNTTQSALYEAEHRCDRRSRRTGERRADAYRTGDRQKKRGGLFDDGDTLLMLVLLYILSREKCDNTLIMSLLIAMLM